MKALTLLLALSLAAPPSNPEANRQRALTARKAGGWSLELAGGASFIGGVAMIALGAGGGVSGANRRNCTVGKPCGNTCISVDKTCHLTPGPTQTSSEADPPRPGLVWGGIGLAAVGVTMVIIGTTLLVRDPPWMSVVNLELGPSSLTLHF
jgi:hypothetical protein